MKQRGLLITFEGAEACGKSTQIARLTERLRSEGHDPLCLREPGGTSAGESIRHLLQHAPEGESITPETELLLFAASRAQLVREKIEPALKAGRVVICDRFLDSTTVYQGVARRISADATAAINTFAVGECLPHATFLLDLAPEVAFDRLRTSGRTPDRIERESLSFFEAVRAGYLELAAREPQRIRLLDASLPAGVLANTIFEAVKSLMEKAGGISAGHSPL